MLNFPLWVGGAISIALALPIPALAQSITAAPDGTGTVVTIDGNSYQIQGGTQTGANLFHSFQAFGLSSGAIANFFSNSDISNIFGRVVGGNASIIDGLIQANPNLYLMNPAGIVFGTNASLNVGGDFFATTADQMCFEGGCFNTWGVNNFTVLNGNPTTLGFLQRQPGGLVNEGTLEVLKGKSIHLSGGTVVNLGEVIAPGGNATIAAIPGERQVRLTQPGNLLSLEVSQDVLTTGMNPLDLPALLATAPTLTDTKVIESGTVVLGGTVQGAQVDLYATGQVSPLQTGVVKGKTRVIRFTESVENPEQAIFIDARADNPEALLFGAAAGTVTQIIERDENGVAVVSEQLAVISESIGKPLKSVAIAAEGNQGNFWLGNQWIRADNIEDYAAQLQSWGASLTANADLLLYSCFTALGTTGEALVASIAEITGVDVAASVNATSSANYGGDWELEATIGTIEAGNPFNVETLNAWQGKLAIRTVTNLNNAGASSLRDALTGTAGFGGVALADGDTVNFSVSGTIMLTGSAIAWSANNVTIDGSNQTVVVDGNGNDRVFNTAANNATIQNLTIQNGTIGGSEDGGGIRHSGQGTLTLKGITVSSNSARRDGGGVDSNGDVILSNSTVSGNLSGDDGGGIHVDNDATVTVTNSTISGNSAVGNAGGIRLNDNGTITVTDSTISGNSAGVDGGGIRLNDNGTVTVTNSTISGNSAVRDGGGIRLTNDGDVTITDSTISGNLAGDDAGGIHLGNNGALIVKKSTISDNSAGTNAGGIRLNDNGAVTVTDSTISGNSAVGYAGGIRFRNNGAVVVSNSTISGNSSGNDGGGLRLNNNGAVTVSNSTISGNSSGNRGGGIINISGTTSLSNSTLSGNQAANTESNGIYTQSSQIDLSSDGDLNLTDTIAIKDPNATISLSGTNINISIPIQSSGGDIYINATQNVNALNSDATISSSGDTGGNITILAGTDLNLRNLISAGTNGNAGNISITSTGGIATTTFGGSSGLINASGNNGNAGNVKLKAQGETTIGNIFAESLGGAGGTVSLASDRFIRLTQTDTGLFGTSNVSISTAGSQSGGAITIRHGGLGLVPFTVGDASINGSAGSLSTGTGVIQNLNPTQAFLYNFTQGNIQILSTDEPAPLLFPTLGSNPPLLEFYGQSPMELFISHIGEQLGAETTIDYEDGKFAWTIPGEPVDITGAFSIPTLEIDLGEINISAIDEALEGEYEDYYGEEFDGVEQGVNLASIREMLQEIEQQTGNRSVIIYALSYPEALELLLITPSDEPIVREIVPEAPANQLRKTVRSFRRQLGRISPTYHASAQQLHRWLIAPIQDELESYNIDTLIFAMSSGLRSIPMAALHDGNQFLIEQYSLGMIPSVSLTNSDYRSLQNSPVLAMGASEFQALEPLPAVPLELDAIAHTRANNQSFLNETFTFANLQTHSQNHHHQIVHLATHAKFQAGNADESYIQFWQDAVKLPALRSLGWYQQPQVELLVLSACETALGDAQAELGFAGLAVQTGAKSALASLWQVSDVGTLALMNQLYGQLGAPDVPIKAEALRQAQLSLLRGEITAQDVLAGVEGRSSDLNRYAQLDLAHPFYWSAFTLVGSPW
ncbi:MAG: CHAT domain-containing protein [Spirulina sp. SIO3F2]|nr:CHAT domain-containing protein [Spirulina sp. SIO3F2]